MSSIKRKVLAILLLISVAACGSIEQLNRDDKRYGATKRGTESYSINSGSVDSLNSAITRGEREIGWFERHYETTHGVGNIESFTSVHDRTVATLEAIKQALKPIESDLSKELPKTPSALRKNAQSLIATRSAISETAERNKKQFDLALEDEDDVRLRNARLAAYGLWSKTASLGRMVEVFCASDQIQKSVKCSTDNQGSTQAESGAPAHSETAQNSGRFPQITSPKIVLPRGQIEGAPPPAGLSQIEIFWPPVHHGMKRDQVSSPTSGSTTPTVTDKWEGASDELIRAYSSTASIAQMRDLLTEPAFPTLLPLKRTVELGCLPPPDAAVFEATAQLAAEVAKSGTADKSLSVKATADFSSNVIKMFEETERTLFLQYALFRLCEMSVNAPSGFRNVYPVVIHDMVRRTAEMQNLANKEAETRRAEEEKTAQQEQITKQKELEAEIQKLKVAQEEQKGKQEQAKLKIEEEKNFNARQRAECINTRRADAAKVTPPPDAAALKKIDEDCKALFPT